MYFKNSENIKKAKKTKNNNFRETFFFARPKPEFFTIDYKVNEDPSTAIWTLGKTLDDSKYDSRHTLYTPIHMCVRRCVATQYFIWSDARPKPYLFTIDYRVHEDPSTAIWALGKTLDHAKYDSRHTSYTPMVQRLTKSPYCGRRIFIDPVINGEKIRLGSGVGPYEILIRDTPPPTSMHRGI